MDLVIEESEDKTPARLRGNLHVSRRSVRRALADMFNVAYLPPDAAVSEEFLDEMVETILAHNRHANQSSGHKIGIYRR